MKIIRLFRALFVLGLAPVLTFAVSVLSLIAMTVFGMSAERVQLFPRFWGRVLVRASGVTVRVEGLENLLPGRPYIFAANHQSQFDIFALQGYFAHDFRWLAKKELFSLPFFGTGMRLAGNIPVDRSRGRQALKSLEAAAERIAAGTSVIIFPEGTRSIDGTLQPFKAGGMVLAIKASVPLVPVAIIGTHGVLPKGKMLVHPGQVVIRIGSPIETSGYSLPQKQELAERLRTAVATLLAG